MLNEYKRRRDWVIPALNEIPGIDCAMPEGAFYAFPNLSKLFTGKVKNSSDMAKFLLDDARVAVTAGSAFGAEGYIRMSYANSLEALQDGVRRIGESVRRIV
jgi:aspartate aminotransferase